MNHTFNIFVILARRHRVKRQPVDHLETIPASRRTNEHIVEFRHSGAEDFLGHSAIVRVRGNNVVVVMSNGDRDDVEWVPDVAGTLVELLGL
jgi:hypothetical protein